MSPLISETPYELMEERKNVALLCKVWPQREYHYWLLSLVSLFHYNAFIIIIVLDEHSPLVTLGLIHYTT